MNKHIHFVFLLVLANILFLSSCSTYKNRGRVDTQKDVKTEKRDIEFQYSFFEGNKQKMLGNFKDAGAYYLKCLSLKPNSAASNYEFASILVMAQDYSSATKYAKRAYEVDPNNKWYQALLITVYKSQGQLKKASVLLEDMIQKHHDDYNSYLELTDTYLKMDRNKEALKTLDKFEDEYGFSEPLMVEKNRIHLRQGNYAEARLEVQKMIKLKPSDFSYYILLADLYKKEGQIEKAYEIYQQVLKEEPNNGRAHYSLMEYYKSKGQNEASYKELEKVMLADDIETDIKIKMILPYIAIKSPNEEEKKKAYNLMNLLLDKYPKDMDIHSIYSDLLVKDKNYKEAKKELLLIIENKPDNYAVWEQLLYIDNQLADFESLYKNATKMIDYFPDRSIAYFFSGLSAYQINKYKDAAEYLESGIDFCIGDTLLKSQFYTLLGDTYHRLKKNKKSDEAYENVIRLSPNNYYVYNNYSYYLSVRKEKLNRAINLMEECIKANPKNSTYLDTFAWVLYQDKRYKEALKFIERAYNEGGKSSAVITEHYGDILYSNNLKDEALEKWKEALSKGKASPLLEKKVESKTLIEE